MGPEMTGVWDDDRYLLQRWSLEELPALQNSGAQSAEMSVVEGVMINTSDTLEMPALLTVLVSCQPWTCLATRIIKARKTQTRSKNILMRVTKQTMRHW